MDLMTHLRSPLTTMPTSTERCSQCGNALAVDANFCDTCGAARDDRTANLDELVQLAAALDADDDLAAVISSLPVGTGLLVIRRGPNAPSRYLLDDREVLIGRDADVDIFLDDQTVSRHHARLRRTPTGFEVDDLGSLNGTYVDGRCVERSELRHLGELRIGTFVLVLIKAPRSARTQPP
jgi:hypothetical protein